MFELLLSVSGVGAKSALSMLSCIEPSEFALAVISNNVKVLTQIPGIGNKSAQRIILELKDKLKAEQTEQTESTAKTSTSKSVIEENNNFGDFKRLDDDISELRFNFGSGYRIYYYEVDNIVVLLLNAGDKKQQNKDILKAKEYLAIWRHNNDGI